jgi:hypothetical protein
VGRAHKLTQAVVQGLGTRRRPQGHGWSRLRLPPHRASRRARRCPARRGFGRLALGALLWRELGAGWLGRVKRSLGHVRQGLKLGHGRSLTRRSPSRLGASYALDGRAARMVARMSSRLISLGFFMVSRSRFGCPAGVVSRAAVTERHMLWCMSSAPRTHNLRRDAWGCTLRTHADARSSCRVTAVRSLTVASAFTVASGRYGAGRVRLARGQERDARADAGPPGRSAAVSSGAARADPGRARGVRAVAVHRRCRHEVYAPIRLGLLLSWDTRDTSPAAWLATCRAAHLAASIGAGAGTSTGRPRAGEVLGGAGCDATECWAVCDSGTRSGTRSVVRGHVRGVGRAWVGAGEPGRGCVEARAAPDASCAAAQSTLVKRSKNGRDQDVG